jgi:hypothetical protein
LTQELKL